MSRVRRFPRLAVVEHSARLDILSCLDPSEPMSVAQVCSRIGLHMTQAKHHLRILNAFGLARDKGDEERGQVLYVTPPQTESCLGDEGRQRASTGGGMKAGDAAAADRATSAMNDRISFRPFRPADGDALVSWAPSADELLQWSGPHFSFPLDEKQLETYAATADKDRHLISGVKSETNSVVAHAELNLLSEHDVGQIRRVAVAPEMRGRGVGLTLMQWLVSFAFNELQLNRLELVVFSFNDPARRCYAAAGFREEGRAREARRASGGYWDLIYMALLKSWRPPDR